MGILHPEDRGQWWAPQTPDCAFCGSTVALNELAQFWAFADDTPTILLHPACAEKFGIAQIKDKREIELASGLPPWRDRTERIFLTTLTSSNQGTWLIDYAKCPRSPEEFTPERS